jgi:hypothetical protein
MHPIEASFFDNLFLVKLGLDENSRKEAKEIWSMLDNLSISDPGSYHAYIKEQAQSMQEMLQRPDPTNFILPEKGFALKVKLAKQTNNSIRIRSDFLFINFCKHRYVKMPYDPKGIDASTTSGTIHIPLGISPLRDTEDENGNLAYVVDIVSNPWCCTSGDVSFIESYIQLGISSVQEEHQLSFTNPEIWEQLSCTYYNCRHGQQLEEVVPFSIMKNANQSVLSITMNDPSTIGQEKELKCIRTSKPRRDGKILIEEIESTCTSEIHSSPMKDS